MDLSSQNDSDNRAERTIYWQANESMSSKNYIWYIAFGMVTLFLMILAVFFIKSLTFVILIPIVVVAIFIHTQRPSRTYHYALTPKVLHIDDRTLRLEEFKNFILVDDNSQYSIKLIPIKRFRLVESFNLNPEIGEEVIDILASRLPMVESLPDVFDKLTKFFKM